MSFKVSSVRNPLRTAEATVSSSISQYRIFDGKRYKAVSIVSTKQGVEEISSEL